MFQKQHLKPLIKSTTKGYDIMKGCSKKLVVPAKNNVKQRMYSSLKKVKEFNIYLKNILSEEYYILMTNNSKEKYFLKKKRKQLIVKYNNLLEYSQRSNYKASLTKPAIPNPTSREIPKHYKSL